MANAAPWRPCARCGGRWRPSVNSHTDLCTRCRICETCGARGVLARGLRYCSIQCRVRARGSLHRLTVSCGACQRSFTPRRPNQRYCDADCKRRARSRRGQPSQPWSPQRRAYCDARRARKKATAVEVIRAEDIFERDGWRCGICSEPVDPELAYPDPRSASLDHVVPLVAHGAHTPENLQCSHLDCNVRKGTKLLAETAG